MKKLTIAIITLCLFLIGMNCRQLMGQTVLFSDNFDSYIAGQTLASQGAPNWTTWSEAPGGVEDPTIVTDQSHSTAQSAMIAGSNDGVLLLNDKTTGRYEISLWIYVPAGKLGYYNILQDFVPLGTSIWGLEIFFDAGGVGSINAGGEGTGSFYYNYNTWFNVRHIIDLDNDFATTYVNNELVVEWQWSLGATGSGQNKLDAMDFYAWTGDKGTPTMYIDDITFSQVESPAAPLNLQATLTGNNVTLNWETPATGTPTGYRIYKDNKFVTEVAGLTYDDINVYPGTHSYTVRADYDGNISSPSNVAEVNIEGGADRNYVLVEIGTGTWCQYCPGAAMGADDLVENGCNVAVIEYHNGDDFTTTNTDGRNNYYNITGFPTAVFDGGQKIVGGNHTTSLYSSYLPIYEARKDVQSIFTLDMDVAPADASDIHVDVNMNKIFNYTTGNMKLHLAVTESDIQFAWQGQTELNFVCREMYPDFNGTAVDFSSNTNQTLSYDITLPSDWVQGNCELIAFLQDDNSQEVMQTAKFNLNGVGISANDPVLVSIYPNPATDHVTLSMGNTNIKNIDVYNTLGQLTHHISTDSKEVNLNTSAWDNGIYTFRITTDKGTVTRKMMKN